MRTQRSITVSAQSILVTLLVLLSSCVAATQGTSDGNPDVISQQEIQELGDVGDAYTLIQHYEPQWLETRGQGSLERPNEVVVYLDNSEQGGPSSLRQISVSNVQKIEFLSPAEANMKFGSGHANGAIMVHPKEGKTPRSP